MVADTDAEVTYSDAEVVYRFSYTDAEVSYSDAEVTCAEEAFVGRL